jgi:multidrug resistance efflux pump
VARASVDQAGAVLEACLQAVEDARQFAPARGREERVSLAQAQAARARANLDAARSAMQALERGATPSELEAAQAAVDAAAAGIAGLDSQIASQTLRAPIDGVVLDHLFLPGELALPGQPVVALADLRSLTLTVYLPEGQLHRARLGAPVSVQVDAYPNRTFPGQVTYIADEAEFTPRNVQTPEDRVILVYAVRIEVPNPEGALVPGLPADAIFEVKP